MAVFQTRKVFTFDNFISLTLQAGTCHHCRETSTQNKQVKKIKTWSYNSCLIRQSFLGYRRCESGIDIFAWRVTLSYAYNPIKTQQKNFKYRHRV